MLPPGTGIGSLISCTNPFRVSYLSSVKFQTLIFGLVGGVLIGVPQYTQSCFIVIEHSLEIFGALVGIPATPMQTSAQPYSQQAEETTWLQ